MRLIWIYVSTSKRRKCRESRSTNQPIKPDSHRTNFDEAEDFDDSNKDAKKKKGRISRKGSTKLHYLIVGSLLFTTSINLVQTLTTQESILAFCELLPRL